MSDHKHHWKLALHLDGCHYYQSSYSCECGATASTYDERDVSDNPYSMIWMTDEDGDVACARCDELLNGAKTRHEQTIEEAKT